jgi:hypothetical protein
MAAPGPQGGSRRRGGMFAMERKPVGRRTGAKPRVPKVAWVWR